MANANVLKVTGAKDSSMAAKMAAAKALALSKLPSILRGDGNDTFTTKDKKVSLVVVPGKVSGSYTVTWEKQIDAPVTKITKKDKGAEAEKGAKAIRLLTLIQEANSLYAATVAVEQETETLLEGRKVIKSTAMLSLARKMKEIKDSGLWEGGEDSSFHAWATRMKVEGILSFSIAYVHQVVSLLEHEVIGPELGTLGIRKALLLTRAEKAGTRATVDSVKKATKTGSKALIEELGLGNDHGGEGGEITIKAVKNRLDKYFLQVTNNPVKKDRDKDLLALLTYLQEQGERVKAVIKA